MAGAKVTNSASTFEQMLEDYNTKVLKLPKIFMGRKKRETVHRKKRETSFIAIDVAASHSFPNSYIFMLSDEPPTNPSLKGKTLEIIKAKQLKVSKQNTTSYLV